MQGVSFGNKHSYRTWGLALAGKPTVSPPKPKIKLVEVPGSDSVIDLTETLTGQVHYQLREIRMEFVLPGSRSRWESVFSDLLHTLHGKNHRIIFDEDPNFYYEGRVTVERLQGGRGAASIGVTAQVRPYKYQRYGEGKEL